MEIDGLHTICAGEGPGMLVMHGPLGIDHTYLRPWLDGLGAAVELVYYDSRGNGRSRLSGSRDEIGIDSLCADAERIREHFGFSQIVLLGHSTGAGLALEYARRYPARLLGLILVSGTPRLDVEALLAELGRRGTAEQMTSFGHLLSATSMDDEEFRENWLRIQPLYHRRYLAEYQRVWDKTTFCGPAWIQFRNHILGALDSLAWLPEIKAPTLILTGRHDPFAPLVESAGRLHAGLANSELVVFEESGHFPFFEEPARFSTTVVDWLSRFASAGVRT